MIRTTVLIITFLVGLLIGAATMTFIDMSLIRKHPDRAHFQHNSHFGYLE